MPLTCSHPAAILPFKRLTPTPFNFAALIIGSMSPDFGYFIGQRHLAQYAHYPSGTILICIPTGLFVLSIFWLIRRQLCWLLPNPHRNQLLPLTEHTPKFTLETFFLVAVSLLLGAWTHIIWDQFTHDGNFGYRHIALLRTRLFRIGDFPIHVAYLLQYISTIAGAIILAVYYLKWLRAQPSKPDDQPDRWRYFLIFAAAIISLATGLLFAIHLSAPFHEFRTFREFAYKMGVISIAMFTILIVISSIVFNPRGEPTN